MPKDIINYSNTIIYKLVCNDLDIKDCYVGHTTNFIKRKQHHKESCINPNNKGYHLKVYQMMRENGGWINWSMIEIEKFPCNDHNEATKQERYWYEVLNANMNHLNPNRTKKEYRDSHKEEIAKQGKEYRDSHKEKIFMQRKQFRDNHKDELKEKKHEFYEQHKEQILLHQKEYKEKHKEEIKLKRAVIYICICGISYTNNHKSRHEKSKKHQEFIQQKN